MSLCFGPSLLVTCATNLLVVVHAGASYFQMCCFIPNWPHLSGLSEVAYVLVRGGTRSSHRGSLHGRCQIGLASTLNKFVRQSVVLQSSETHYWFMYFSLRLPVFVAEQEVIVEHCSWAMPTMIKEIVHFDVYCKLWTSYWGRFFVTTWVPSKLLTTPYLQVAYNPIFKEWTKHIEIAYISFTLVKTVKLPYLSLKDGSPPYFTLHFFKFLFDQLWVWGGRGCWCILNMLEFYLSCAWIMIRVAVALYVHITHTFMWYFFVG